MREVHTVSTSLEHLANDRTGQAADVCAQHLKALELSATEGNWEKAQHLELVEPEGGRSWTGPSST